MSSDRFGSHEKALADPATRHFAIVLGTDLEQPTRGIYVGADGDLVIQDMNGTEVTYYGAKAGSVIPIRSKKVVSSTASPAKLVGLY